MRGIRSFVTLIGFLSLVACDSNGSSKFEAKKLTCPSATTLESLVTCIRDQMPQDGSNGYTAPNPQQRSDWKAASRQMLQGQCDFPVTAPPNGIIQVRTFKDTENGRIYCLMMEVFDQDGNGYVDYGFGAFITYNNPAREISHQAVHPLADSTTEVEAVTLFKKTDARSYLMAGAHRNASDTNNPAFPLYRLSDASHNANTMVQATNEALLAHYGTTSWFAIQWHGMAESTCENTEVYLSHGIDTVPLPTDKIAVLRDKLLAKHPTWRVDLPGANKCSLTATDNLQGRLLNGVPENQIYSSVPLSYTQRFIHIEQDPNFRNPADWIEPIKEAFP